MDPFVEMLLWTTLAGACIPVGAGFARIEHIRPQWLEDEFRHFVIAFGGGVLLGAVALVLVPEGSERLPQPLAVVTLILACGVAFMVLDRVQGKRKRATPQSVAMAADFLPESLALGGMFAATAEAATLLALLIGVQNLPEGFNAWRELACGQFNRSAAQRLMLLLALLGPVCGLIGWFWLAGNDAVLGAIMLFAGGGILYLTFQDIAPQSRLERHWGPATRRRTGIRSCRAGKDDILETGSGQSRWSFRANRQVCSHDRRETGIDTGRRPRMLRPHSPAFASECPKRQPRVQRPLPDGRIRLSGRGRCRPGDHPAVCQLIPEQPRRLARRDHQHTVGPSGCWCTTSVLPAGGRTHSRSPQSVP